MAQQKSVWEWIADIYSKYHTFYFDGLKYTVLLGVVSIIFGVLLGVLVALLRLSRIAPLRWIAVAYIDFLRSTPAIVQVSLIYFGGTQLFPTIPDMLGLPSVFFYGVIALSINSSAYVAEIMRAGILSVDKGQMEAARSLGMPHGLAMRNIILPQAVKNIIPALGNEFVVVVKETAVVSTIGVGELMYKAGVIRGITFRGLEPYIIVMIFYFVVVFTLSKLVGLLERRMRASD
ncbi:amino acid ABC transporter permease [Paenibacillus antri]|uniref:Amino acid ABC transporter permease n=1 Tax=Paenibacillus antri TaxID=2582848 RepID=A0A5R9G3Z9_9BACL|nr:amino acid ABC transporter permease [Paenibacillus antri]TLS51102.1 amino acid ABC transporter permease [Paenibacillus antri]